MRYSLILFGRNEQKTLRKFLINNACNVCVVCKKQLPLYILECCHIKPRYLLNNKEIYDTNNVMFMCRNCHKIYDNGEVGIKNNKIIYNKDILNYSDLNLINEDIFLDINNNNRKYFDFHYNNIFKK